MHILNKYGDVVGERINNHQVIIWGIGWNFTITIN